MFCSSTAPYINEAKEAVFHFLTWNVKAEVWEGCKDKSQPNYSVSGNQAASASGVTLHLDAANLGRHLMLTWTSCCCSHCLLSRLKEQGEHPSWQVVYSFYLSFIKSENKASPQAKNTLKSLWHLPDSLTKLKVHLLVVFFGFKLHCTFFKRRIFSVVMETDLLTWGSNSLTLSTYRL